MTIELLESPTLTPAAKLVWALIFYEAMQNGPDGKSPKVFCDLSQQEIAQRVGLKLSTVHREIKNLVSYKLIIKEAPKGIDRLTHGTMKYFLLKHPLFKY